MICQVNEDEYKRLAGQKMSNPVIWKFKQNLFVERIINNLFELNKFFYNIVFDDKYSILNNEFISEVPDVTDFHNFAITLKDDVSYIDMPEMITGIVSFTYVSWNQVGNIMSKIPDSWSLFIVNPILMRYENTIALFFTPKYDNNSYILEFNRFIISKTGYPLFLRFTEEKLVTQINYFKPDLSVENFVRDFKKYSKSNSVSKLLDFWLKNDCVKIMSFEYNYNCYKDNLPYHIYNDIDFIDVKSTIPFELVHEFTHEKLGPFKKFNLDKSFKLIDTENGVFNLSDRQVNDLIDGKYDFLLLK